MAGGEKSEFKGRRSKVRCGMCAVGGGNQRTGVKTKKSDSNTGNKKQMPDMGER